MVTGNKVIDFCEVHYEFMGPTCLQPKFIIDISNLYKTFSTNSRVIRYNSQLVILKTRLHVKKT